MIRLIFAILCLPTLLWAEDFPALYDITDVASDDVLNLRAEASASSDTIGAIAHNSRNIEVIATNGNWGQINSGEGIGWVSLRYMARQEPNPDYALAQRISCYGTEPFWGTEFVQGQNVQFTSPEGGYDHPGAGLMVPASGVPDLWAMAFGDSVATIRREICSDGMSDRQFGLSVALYHNHDGEIALLSGCCSITGY